MPNDTITKLAERHLKRAKEPSAQYKPILALVGEASPFLLSVEKTAGMAGIQTIHGYREGYACVVDKETTKEIPPLTKEDDIDYLEHEGTSCVSQAAYELLMEYGVAGKNVTIVGRGHAVKGLAEHLLAEDASVAVTHSKTGEKKLQKLLDAADIAVIATPVLDAQPVNCKLVLDISGVTKASTKAILSACGATYITGIGRLTTAILSERVASSEKFR